MECCFAQVFELRFPEEVVGEEVVGDVEKNFLWKGDECWSWWREKGLHGWFFFGNLQRENVEWVWCYC